ncbi:MAG: hypothetical protein IPO62_09140 [Saprospiraceae bacterium]|nr:hypothetical protein [Saprospiraceae bacterium]
MTLSSPLDAREQTIENEPAPFCQMICRAMSRTSKDIDFSIMNSGSVRVDDEFKTDYLNTISCDLFLMVAR